MSEPTLLAKIYAHHMNTARYIVALAAPLAAALAAGGATAIGLLSGMELKDAVEWCAAHDALPMTTPGDTSTATLDEVRSLVGGAAARVRR